MANRNQHIDLAFDLDEALTAVDSSSEISRTNSLVSNLPTVVPVAGATCTVCREGFQEGDGGKQLPCGHVYHSSCITSWLSNHNTCPLCRCTVSGA